jgi:ribosomal protein L3 glutamine methyltransferase
VERDVVELRSVRDFMRWGASQFARAGLHFGHGTDNALDESIHLVLHALKLSHEIPDSLLPAVLTEDERREVLDLLWRRIDERMPAAYLTGSARFAGLWFYVDQRVLVPRSPIAEWIEQGFAPFLDTDRVARILDIGTGSGCIAVACAVAFPDALVEALDISTDALEVARINIGRHHLDQRVRAVKSDLYDHVDGRFDLIVSNPPYVDAIDMAELPQEYRHEPVLGLAAGEDGLDVVRRIVSQSAAHLNDDGVLVLELGASREAFEQAFPELEVVWLEFEHGGENVLLTTKDALSGQSG